MRAGLMVGCAAGVAGVGGGAFWGCTVAGRTTVTRLAAGAAGAVLTSG